MLLLPPAPAGSSQAVDFLIRQGAAVNVVDKQSSTPLHEAAVKGDAGLVRALLAAGADPGVRNAAGALPLHISCQADDLPLTQLLLEAHGQPFMALPAALGRRTTAAMRRCTTRHVPETLQQFGSCCGATLRPTWPVTRARRRCTWRR